MKNRKSTLLLLLAVLAASFSSCVKDNYQAQPTPSGYTHSFNDDFQYDRHNWSFKDPANGAEVYLNNGLLSYTYFPKTSGTNTVAVSTGADLNHNWDIQTRIKSDNAMGLVFGVSPTEYGYSVFLDNKGFVAVYDEGNAQVSPKALLSWQSTTAIRSGWNDLEVEQFGNSWIGYINNTKVFELPAHTLYGHQIGYMVLANTNGQADYLTVQW